ncbi:MAG TPA: glycoside hydrolase domain-containing protein [Anaeromyxobacter sp.]|nr:glycoside hydrolase domain-containing protein [Anaeromyxobacter sp.]
MATATIRPDAQPRATTEATLAAARNEFESFQVVVSGRATGVKVEATPLGSGDGQIADPKLYREDLIDVRQPSALDGATGRWPDALVPAVDDVVGEQRNAFPFDVGDGESRAVWVEYYVPQGTKPGTYRGGVKVTSSEGEAVVPVTFTVWDFELPSTSSLRSYFNMAYGTIPAAHHLSGDADAQLRARYASFALDHRISITVGDDGNDGDIDHFDRFYSPLVQGTAPTRLPGAKLTSVKLIANMSSADDQRRWTQHARSQGWLDRLFQYTCDEPPLTCSWSDINGRTKAAHDADADLRTLVTTTIWDAGANGVTNGIDILVPVVNWTDDKPGKSDAGDQRGRYDGFLASGKTRELWLYQSCMSHGCGGTVDIGSPSDDDRYYTGWPTYMIDAPAVRNRAMEWISFAERATGELYWETTFAYTHDAWSNQWDFSGNGDGTLFYPGTTSRIGGQTDIPVASIRLKMIREGMEDFEYLKALADAGDPQLAHDIARKLFPNAYSTDDVDAGALMQARGAIAARIVELRGGQSSGVGGVMAGGCGSAGGLGGGALLALPAVLGMALFRRRRAQ